MSLEKHFHTAHDSWLTTAIDESSKCASQGVNTNKDPNDTTHTAAFAADKQANIKLKHHHLDFKAMFRFHHSPLKNKCRHVVQIQIFGP